MRNNNYGFTLIEVIVIIVLAGIVAGVMVPFMGAPLTKSNEPLENLGHATALSSQMAKLLADYDPSSSCGELQNDWDIENAAWFDSSKATLASQTLCYFDADDILVCDGTAEPEVLQVRLRSAENSGEFLTYYFPCEP